MEKLICSGWLEVVQFSSNRRQRGGNIVQKIVKTVPQKGSKTFSRALNIFAPYKLNGPTP